MSRPRRAWTVPVLLAVVVLAGAACSHGPSAPWTYLDDPGADGLVLVVEAAVGAGTPGAPGASLPATDTEAAGAEPVIPVRHFAAAVLVVTVFVGMLVLAVGPAPRRRR